MQRFKERDVIEISEISEHACVVEKVYKSDDNRVVYQISLAGRSDILVTANQLKYAKLTSRHDRLSEAIRLSESIGHNSKDSISNIRALVRTLCSAVEFKDDNLLQISDIVRVVMDNKFPLVVKFNQPT